MVQQARISLSSTNVKPLQAICEQFKNILQKTGARFNGPISLPLKKVKIAAKKTPLKLHRRLIVVDANEHTMKQLLCVTKPDDVFIEIELM